jgi:hypothetical protein
MGAPENGAPFPHLGRTVQIWKAVSLKEWVGILAGFALPGTSRLSSVLRRYPEDPLQKSRKPLEIAI